jgi:hypothetical protein
MVLHSATRGLIQKVDLIASASFYDSDAMYGNAIRDLGIEKEGFDSILQNAEGAILRFESMPRVTSTRPMF